MRNQSLIKACVAILFLLVINVANSAKKVTAAFGEVLAPWVLVDTNRGIIVDLLEATISPLDYEIEHLYLPYARRSKAYKAEGINVVSDMNLNTINQYNLPGYFS